MAQYAQVLATLLATALFPANLMAQPITFTDVTGTQVSLPSLPQRIITLPNPAAATFIALDGSSEKLVGMNEGSKRAFTSGMMAEMFPQAQDIPSDIVAESGGWMPNVEAIAALRPDLVIQWGGRGDDIVDPLKALGLPVALMQGGGNGGTEALARDNMRMAAEITGKTDKLTQLFAWRDRVAADIKAGLAGAETVQSPRILHLRSAKSKLTATGEASYQNIFIEMVGGRNVAAGLGVEAEVNVEQILAWDPDMILLSAAESDAGLEAIHDHPLLSQLRAAKEGRVYKTPVGGYVWDSASHESPFTWMWLANLAQPDLFRFDLRQEVRDGFKLLYGYEVSEAQIDRILRLELNGATKGYAVFAAQ